MKATYIERIERRTAFSRKMYCPACGGHEYEIVEQLEPKCEGAEWFIRCSQCSCEGLPAPLREIAIGRWKQYVNGT